jgi:hypothetical protein
MANRGGETKQRPALLLLQQQRLQECKGLPPATPALPPLNLQYWNKNSNTCKDPIYDINLLYLQ